MRKVLVATHGRFAEGIRETMQFIMGSGCTVDVLNAYTEPRYFDRKVIFHSELVLTRLFLSLFLYFYLLDNCVFS